MSLKTLLNKTRKVTGSESFATSRLGDISGYVSTGSYALNRIISGDIHKGIPNGRVVIFSGESQSGKSLIAAEITANALEEEDFDIVFYFDSEGGGLKSFFKGRGCDLNKIEHVPLENVEDATVKILAVYAQLKEERKVVDEARKEIQKKITELESKKRPSEKNKTDLVEEREKLEKKQPLKAMCIVDSLGALVATKLITDAEKGKQVQDMGSRAKLCNNLVKGCTIPALISDATIIFINHVYADPSAMYASKIKNQSGGKGLQFVSSITIQCDKRVEKSEGEEDTYYKGAHLKFFCTKNRLIKPFYQTEVYIDFDKGIGRYQGLLDDVVKYGFIEDNRIKNGYFTIPSWSGKEEELIKKDNIFDTEYYEAWESFLEEFNTKSIKDMRYSSKEYTDMIAQEEEAEIEFEKVDEQETEKEESKETPQKN